MAIPSSDSTPPELRVTMDMEFELTGPVSTADHPRLHAALIDLPGVETIDFLEDGGIAVRYDPEKVTRDGILTVVGQSGFQVRGSESAPPAPVIESPETGSWRPVGNAREYAQKPSKPRINNVEPRRFPPDLLYRVQTFVEREGYCIFSAAEMERLLAPAGGTHAARREYLEEFAQACGAEVETTPHFTSGRFVKLAPKKGRE
jgi:hypothetical protein